MKTEHMYAAGAAVTVVGAASWYFYRSSQRAKLAALLAGSDRVTQAYAAGVIHWTPDSKASELIGFTNTLDAKTAFALVLSEINLLLPEASAAEHVVKDVLALASEKASSVYDSLPDVPGVDTSTWSITKWLTGA